MSNGMEQAQWQRIEDLLQEALDLDPGSRAEFLTRACGNDDALRRQLESMLDSEPAGAILDRPAVGAFLRDLAHSLEPGTKAGHYTIEGRIGAGGMGEVYRAVDESLQRRVALKVLPPEFTSDPARVRRFEQEALAASRLNHPNIITIFEILREQGNQVIATEYIEGSTLRELLSSASAPMEIEKAIDVSLQMASALRAAHTAWIIHRDIKPENIMVRDDGLVKLVDFGIAKLSEDPAHTAEDAAPAGAREVTAFGSIVGTASYMSPEQARGESLDGRTDLYSLGLVLFEMLTGRRWQPGSLDLVPKDLQRIVNRLLQEKRDDRYGSAADLIADLRLVERRLQNRSARRLVAGSLLAVALMIVVAALTAVLSVTETWREQILREGHSAAARHAAFSPDGRLLVSCGEDGRVFVWDVGRLERVAAIDHRAHKVAFAKDGRTFATGGADGNVVVWSARDYAKTATLFGTPGEVVGLTYLPHSSRILFSVGDNWFLGDSDTGRIERRITAPGFSHGNIVFTADGNATTSHGVSIDPTGLQPWSQGTRQGNWLAQSPDRAREATVDPHGVVRLYRAARGTSGGMPEALARAQGHQDHGRTIEFSPDGTLLASGAEDIILWDAATLRKIARFEHSAVVWSLTFSPDGRWLASTHADGAVLLWDVAERARAANMNEHGGAVRSVSFSADGRRVVSASEDRTVVVWDARTHQRQTVLTGHRTRVNDAEFMPSGNQVVSVDQDGVVLIFDVESRKARLRLADSLTQAVYTVAASPDGTMIATTRALHRVSDGAKLMGLAFSPGWPYSAIYGAAFSPDGTMMYCVTSDGWILAVDVQRRRITEKVRIQATLVCISLSKDGRHLVTGENEGAVRLWSTSPLREVAVIGRHTARVKAVALSPDMKSVASAGDDERIALWNVPRRRLRMNIGTHVSPVYAVAFSPDGASIVSGEHDRTVRIYTRERRLFGFEID
jgi:WD40 repeat protein/serine/threonine protein kinase